MNRLRAPPAVANRKKQQKISIKIEIDIRKGMTMNHKNKKGKRLTSTLMAVLMSVSTTLTPVNSIASEMETSSIAVESTVEETTAETEVQTTVETTASSEAQTSASETQAITEETTAEADQPETESSATEEAQSSGESAEETSANETRGPDEAEETSEMETEVETEFETEIESETETEANLFESLDPASGLSESDLAGIDFSSKRLLVAADATVLLDPEHVLSSYAGVYLLQYETETQAKYAYAYYYSRSEFVDVDTVISVADGDGSANAAAPMAAEENPIAELQEAVAENPVKATGAVAVIDTGVNGVANVTESVSMIGDNTADENGHGTKMAQLIAEQNPNVSILSIKALGADGTGDVSAVYAAIQYAIDKQVSVINLSMSALGTAENAALTAIVNDAVAAGIAVVGAAGNNGHDVRFYVPGNIESAYIIGAADEDGARIASSNYGTTVDYNVVADSTSEAAAKFSGYYTLNGAVADEKLVFPTDYKKTEVNVDFNGPIIKHQISYYNYQGSRTDLVWVAQREAKTAIEDEYFTTYIGFVEDASKVQDLDVCVDFMNVASEHKITDECIVDLENMTVQIPVSYKDADITVRWYMSNASYGYCYDTDSKYMISNTPEKFMVAKNSNNSIAGLDFAKAQLFVAGTYNKAYTHAANSMNHCNVNYSTDGINVGDWFTIQDGYMTSIQDVINNGTYYYTSHEEVRNIFGENALTNLAGTVTIQAFLTHFSVVTRDSDGADVSSWFNSITGKGNGVIKIDANNDGHIDTQVDANLGWVFGTCANDYLDGQCPTFEPGGKIICTSKDADGTAYFFFYCRSPRAQWTGGSFSITPVVPKTGYLQIHKSSSNPEITNGNSCYNFAGIQYGIFTDEACVNNLVVLSLDANGYTQPYELPEGTYYVREADATPGSGYKTNGTVYTVNVTAGTTADAPITCETADQPLNDPLGIVINKINGDGTTTADLSGAEYTITYYPKQYTSVAEIEADTDPEVKPTVWVIQTLKAANGNYRAMLDDAHIVPNSNSAGAVFEKNYTGNYIIPLGTITVEETKAPTGFTKDGAVVSSAKTGATISGTNNVYLFQLVDENSAVYLKSGNTLSTSVDDETAITLTYAEVQNKAGIRIAKYDASTGGAASGDADLSGIKFAIVNNTGAAIINYAGYTIENGAVAQVVTTDSNGYAATGANDLPVGSYIVRELRQDAAFDGKNFYEGTSALANDSYQWQDNQDTVTLTDSDAGQLVWAKAFYNSPVAGVPVMEKHDLELNKKAAMGGTSFEGITFEIYNYSDTPVVVGGVSYAKGEVVATAVSDAEGNITTTATFPVGHYSMKEKSVNNQYTMTEGETHYFNVVSYNGAAYIQYEPGNQAVIFKDRVVRGDLSFVKKNAETDEALAYIPFKITNNATGETHYILTDADGNFTSATGKTSNTNANDEILSQYGEKDVIPQSVIDSLAKDAGLWFGMGSEGTMTDANDSYGAFVYGTYTITELKTEATRNMKMYTNTFTIDTDGKVLDLGTVNNVPMSIKTTLVDVNGEHFTEATSTVTLVDHVAYKNLDTDKTYTLTGTLYVKEGDALTELMTETVDFQPTEITGTQDVTFTFDASALVGKSVVAFEELSLNGEFCAEHKDKNDENQTVVFPGLKTTARDSQTDDHVSNADDSITIIDTVEYSGLHVGNEYTITGTLMDQKTGKAVLDDDGNEITASKVITATESNGSVEIEFQFAGVSLAGKTIVVFENLDYEGKRYAVHADLNDKNQTIYFPSIKTKATDKNTGLNQVKEDSNVTVVDTVTYTGLQPGKTYTMTGMLMSSAGNAISSNGKRITASTEFVPTESDGSVDVVFNFDATNGFGGRQYVFFEYLYLDGVRVAAHTDISDTNQIIYIPSIRTTLIDSENGSHSSAADQDITLIDTVRYNGVEIGRTYTVTGTLVDKATGKEIVDDAGNKITAFAEFTAEKTNGTIDVTFVFSGVSLAGKTIVAYEHMYTEGKEVAVHADLRDESQTEYFPSVHTTATSNDTEDHVVGANEKVTITDQVTLKALKLGTEYTLSGTLVNAKTGKPIVVNGNAITARRTFTADAHEMVVPLMYELNASELAGTTTVVFENLYSDGALLASHADLKDTEQTVYIPEIHTSAKDKKTQINNTEANKTATIIDTVSYTNLLPGKEYTMTGTLMNKETGEAVLIDGKEITASTTFTPVSPDGSVDVVFEFDASILAPTTVVAFEDLIYKGIQIAVHADIEDAEQTVYIPKIRTNAISDDTKNHVVEAKKDITIIDTVSYEGLEIGREYTVKGTLVDQKTGEALKVDGKKVTAETTFTAEVASGAIDVTFVFDGTRLEDTVLVAYEHMYTEGKEVAVHADIEDDEQTIYIPKIRTLAQDAVTEIDHTEALEQATIIDTVTYSSLLPGKEYTVNGTLMNKKTGEAVLLNGEPITAETTFIAEKSSGSVELIFTFDASAIAGTTVVAFESMKYEGIEVAAHADIEDEDQTVYIPDVHTTATALDTKDHVTGANEDLTITDEVVLMGLKIGNEYTVKGVLMDKSTGEELKVNGESITAEETFVADATDMTVTLTYTLDASKLAGTTTVVYETLYTEGKEVGRHHEIEDEGQTVYIPEIHTTAADQETGINHTELNEQATIIDTVYYSHLLPGKEYTVHGVLVDQKTEKPILIAGEEITASTTFTAETSDGSVDVIFTFDASVVAPKTVVAFESMEYEGIEIAVHADIDDENQTVYIPQIHTTAVGEDTQDHIEKAKEDAVIVDTVSYEGLEIGREYTMRGTLVDKETGEPILVNGEKVTEEETFVAEAQEGSIDITFTFNSSALAGKSLVVFEKLYTEEKEVAAHADIEDEGQTVRIPEIHTTATDKVTGDHDGVVAAETTVLDEVFYTNLIPGKEYTVKGTLMVKETGEPLVVDGNEITAEKTFVAEEADGSIVLEFTFNSLALAGKHVVAFEDVEYEGVSIGTHADIEDEDQTISYPSIHTTAADQASGSKTMTLGSSVTLVDTVTYTGLTAGKSYTVKGTVMDKASGEPIGVTAETTFTAEATDGSVVVTFTFDTTVLQGKTLVVFESLYDAQGNLIIDHSDINDEDQTVSVPVQPEIPPVITGDNSTPYPYVAGLTVALLAAVAIAIMLIKRKKA